MAYEPIHLALFDEDEINQASDAIALLREKGIPDRNMTVISGVPFSEHILGRPMNWTRVGLIGLAGALAGFVAAMVLNYGPQLFYPLEVGRVPLFPVFTAIVTTFEITMLGLLISTFIGVFVETITPSYGPEGYDPRITDGKIGILFTCPPEVDCASYDELVSLGAEMAPSVKEQKLWP
ncbi:MAG TPA: quinol:electron acceptor oxidoreductase subunit ActD [Anaerolineaceae bacterium]|nr:quinol:electron acceptor oxidoreductase subunit ActD [Anaerolineaceae bacterium]